MQIDASSVVWETLEKYAQTEPGLLLGELSSSLRLSNKKKVRESLVLSQKKTSPDGSKAYEKLR